MRCRRNSQRNGNQNCNQNAAESKLHRCGEALKEQFHHGAFLGKRCAQVALNKFAKIAEVPFKNGAVHPELLAHHLDLFRSCILRRHLRNDVARSKVHQVIHNKGNAQKNGNHH